MEDGDSYILTRDGMTVFQAHGLGGGYFGKYGARKNPDVIQTQKYLGNIAKYEILYITKGCQTSNRTSYVPWAQLYRTSSDNI